ncbi:MAG: hypothetical protein ACXVII_33885 [Solirubrobacteraceae bacterium]
MSAARKAGFPRGRFALAWRAREPNVATVLYIRDCKLPPQTERFFDAAIPRWRAAGVAFNIEPTGGHQGTAAAA